MAERAQVTSVEAIEAFRAQLILFVSKARPTLEEISSELLRTRLWLQNDQRHHWDNELKQRTKKQERAQSELFGARISPLAEVNAAQQMAVRRAQQAVRDAESKIALLKKWDRDLEDRSEPYIKQVNQLHDYLTTEMPRAVAHLTEIIKTLEAYSDVLRPGPAAPSSASPPPAGKESQGEAQS
jgi:hypothetical protein